jgi:4-hydroxybenzoyl-CoA thioesterase/acyl-CoA thioester hydrolase
MPITYRTQRRVEFCDTDMAGLIHFANYFRYMESAEIAMLRSLGLSVTMGWEGEHISFPRVAASCEFVRPVRFEDLLDILVTVRKLGQKSVTYGFEFFKGEELVARGEISAVCCRLVPGKRIESIEIPAVVRQKLE